MREDMYSEDYIDEKLEEDGIGLNEAAFMKGYLEA